MVVVGAAKTELMLADTSNGWNDPAEVPDFDRAVDRIFTVGCRAPSKVILVIHVCPGEKHAIPMRHTNTSATLHIERKWPGKVLTDP